MADKKISELDQLLQADIVAADEVAVADRSANETRRVTVPDLVQAGVRLMPDGSINGSKLVDETVTEDKLADGAVTEDKLGDGACTEDKLGDLSVSTGKLQDDSVSTEKLQDGACTGTKIADDSIDSNHVIDGAIDEVHLSDNSISTDKIQDGAITGDKFSNDAFDRGINVVNDRAGIQNSILPGTQAGISYNEQGLITSVVDPIPPEDLPLATQTTVGAVMVPATGGLGVTGTGEIFIDNLVTPNTATKVTYDEHGLITNGEDIEPDDLPIATTTTLGAVIVPSVDADGDTALDIDAAGLLTHATTGVAPGTYTKVGVNKYGHVTTGAQLEASDIPELSFDQITGGEIGQGMLGECAVEGPNICDYATCLMQEDHPGEGDFLGQFWFTPSTAQLRVYARGSGPQNIWLNVGFGNLQQNNLRWGGLYDATLDTVTVVTAIGTGDQLVTGPFPPASDSLSGIYLACQVGGNQMTQNDLVGEVHTPGDWVVCLGETQGWVHIDVAAGGGGGIGGVEVLDDLLDVTIGGTASPFSTNPVETLAGDQLLRYDAGAGVWRNTLIIDGGSID